MRILTGLVVVAALGAMSATAVTAKTARLSDVAYLQAARCVGLATSSTLGSPDGEAMKAWLKEQGRARAPYVVGKAEEMQRDAKRDADRADEFTKSRLTAELGGACAQLKG